MERLGTGRLGLAGGASSARRKFGLRGLGGGGHGRVPVEDAAATVAGEKFALAELIPHLGTNTHSATCALLIVDTRQSGAAGGAEAVKAGEPLGFNERPEGFALDVEGLKLRGELVLAESDAGTGFFVGARMELNLGTSLSKRGFLGFSSLETRELLVFEAVSFGGLKIDFVFDGFGLGGSLHGVELGAEAGGLLPVVCDLAFKAGAERLLAAEGRGDF